VLVVRADAPYGDVAALMAAARAAPGRLNYASGGIGSAAHLCAAALALHAGIEAVHVPYKGSVDIVPSILAGDTQFAFPIASTAVPLVRAGRVKALAVSGAARLATLPGVPTLAEALQAPDLVFEAWFGFWAPAGTPAAVVEQLFRALRRAHEDAALRAQSEAAGSLVATSASPQEFARFVTAESVKFERLVAAARLRGDR
jgi:tripartite-type tricarboxylate transporter receptor subunit TctC